MFVSHSNLIILHSKNNNEILNHQKTGRKKLGQANLKYVKCQTVKTGQAEKIRTRKY